MRKPEEISLGPQYAGSRVSREALLNDDNNKESAADSGSEGEDFNMKYANPDDSDLDIDIEDGEINSDEAFGESDSEKFEKFVFRGSGKPKTPNSKGGRATASDFMSEDSEGEEDNDGQDGASETDEDVLDTAEQHQDDSDNEVFSTARQVAESDESDDDEPEDIGNDDDMSDGSESNEDQSQGEEEAEEDDDDEEESGDDQESRRAELRKIMNEEQKTVVATISQAAKADADKGNAVKTQRKSFDSLLSVRMVLQKALVATNSMQTIEEKNTQENAYEAAEQAAVKLWNTLDGLRHELSNSRTRAEAGKKRKRVDVSAPSSKFWEKMQKSEVSMIDIRQTTLEKWSSKVRGTTAVPLTKKLNPTVTQSITSVLQDQFANSEHLIKKTKIPRSCAPIQRDAKITEDPDIYDDGNFYQLLLKELVDQRRVESLNAPAAGADSGNALQWTAVKEAKTKKNVDTKASKGRKMRYTVHEKLQNFMAPEDRGAWEPEAIDRFFGTLLGQKMTLGEDVEMEDDEDGGVSIEEEGLKLFRSV